MSTLIRLSLGPTIIPVYTVYGSISYARRAGNRITAYAAGAISGALYGTFYVLTGKKLSNFIG